MSWSKCANSLSRHECKYIERIHGFLWVRGPFAIITHSTAELGKQIGRVLAFHVDSCHLIHLYGYWITAAEQQGNELWRIEELAAWEMEICPRRKLRGNLIASISVTDGMYAALFRDYNSYLFMNVGDVLCLRAFNNWVVNGKTWNSW